MVVGAGTSVLSSLTVTFVLPFPPWISFKIYVKGTPCRAQATLRLMVASLCLPYAGLQAWASIPSTSHLIMAVNMLTQAMLGWYRTLCWLSLAHDPWLPLSFFGLCAGNAWLLEGTNQAVGGRAPHSCCDSKAISGFRSSASVGLRVPLLQRRRILWSFSWRQVGSRVIMSQTGHPPAQSNIPGARAP